jgi:DNA polymerase-3 subunit gamma/tau
MTYQVIARKWRPQTFADLVGQQHVTGTLANAIRDNRVAHAYIFSGARGVGKTTAARILAKALNCVNGPTPEPCGVCDSCRAIAGGSSLDVIEIDAASNRGIDQIRELREMVRYAPAAARTKVVILDEAHMLTDDASNALLKTLEEPPDRVIFVMATTEPEELADTIRSRSQHFHFRALTFNEIAGRIEQIARKESLQIDSGAITVIARMADGSLRDALSLLEQARAYCGDNITDCAVRELLGVVPEDALNELVSAIAAGSAGRALALVHAFQKEGRNLQHFCREAIRHIRNLLMARVCGADSDLIAATADQRPALAEAARQFSEEDLTRFFQILLQTDDDLRRKPDPRVHLEMGLLRLVNAARLAPLEELLSEMKGGGTGGSSAPLTGGRTGSFSSPAPRSAGASLSSAPSAAPFAAPRPAPPAPSASVPRPSASSSIAAQPPRFSADATHSDNAGASILHSASSGIAEPASQHPDPAPQNTSGAAHGAEVSSSAPDQPAAVAAEALGIAPAQIAEIKCAIQSEKKFLGELVEHAHRWELAGAELRLHFPADRRSFAELAEGRETLEKIRAASSKVLGRSVRVCAKIDSVATAAASASRGGSGSQELRARFERDPMIRSMLQRFGGKITEVRRQGES